MRHIAASLKNSAAVMAAAAALVVFGGARVAQAACPTWAVFEDANFKYYCTGTGTGADGVCEFNCTTVRKTALRYYA